MKHRNVIQLPSLMHKNIHPRLFPFFSLWVYFHSLRNTHRALRALVVNVFIAGFVECPNPSVLCEWLSTSKGENTGTYMSLTWMCKLASPGNFQYEDHFPSCCTVHTVRGGETQNSLLKTDCVLLLLISEQICKAPRQVLPCQREPRT